MRDGARQLSLAMMVGLGGCVTEVESGFGTVSITASDTAGPSASATDSESSTSDDGSSSGLISATESTSSPSSTDDTTTDPDPTDPSETSTSGSETTDTNGDPCDPDPCDAPAVCVDGECVTMSTPQPGDLVIVEFHPDPDAVADDAGEWLELVVASEGPLDLASCELADLDTDSHTIAVASLVVQPGERVVLARDAAAAQNGGIADVAYGYGGSIALANGEDEIVVRCDGMVIDEIGYGGSWPYSSGVAAQLDPGAPLDANDDPGRWCAASSVFGDGDLGTPGEANDPC